MSFAINITALEKNTACFDTKCLSVVREADPVFNRILPMKSGTTSPFRPQCPQIPMQINQAYKKVVELLLQQRDPDGCVWTGRLSSSALSTALAVTALDDGNEEDCAFARQGVQWLVNNMANDGGWGDTPGSPSNISTSLIVRACLSRNKKCKGVDKALSESGAFIMAETGGLSVKVASETLKNIYGDDKTFAVPILMCLSICSDDPEEWLHVPKIPFYLALLPQWCFRFFRLEVVSYALPALIAVGLCRHICVAEFRGKKPWGRMIASLLLGKLENLQPEHGGFLDAVPLTAFVVMALKCCGCADCRVVEQGSSFLRSSFRSDGSCPIDTNLRCWLTSLSARVLVDEIASDQEEAKKTVQWIINHQYQSVHPFTGAKPGGWAWTDCPGGVPDADDTAAALIALFYLKDFTEIASLTKTVRLGMSWLMQLQNRDGGVPTFCRGWGHLPFDKSCCDITSHAVEALSIWRGYIRLNDFIVFDDGFMAKVDKSLYEMVDFLEKQQRPDGSWLPLWFGHQQSEGKLNHIIGTARVLSGLHALRGDDTYSNKLSLMVERGESMLVKEQKKDGGWSAGIDSTIEESALAVKALASGCTISTAAAEYGAAWLADMILNNEIISSPVGLYFSVLWYDEVLYPLIWSAAALKSILRKRM